MQEIKDHREHVHIQTSSAANISQLLEETKTKLADWRDRVKGISEEDFDNVEKSVEAFNAAAIFVMPVLYDQKVISGHTSDRQVWQQDQFAARQADVDALSEILRLNPDSCLAQETRKKQMEVRTVEVVIKPSG